MSVEGAKPVRTEKEIFLRALELGEEERTAFLADVCLGSPGLRERVGRLLAAQGSATFLDRPVRLVSSVENRPETLEGALLGPYRVLREIGRGGMGSVYLAERADHAFEKQVAIKVVRPEVLSDESSERFLKERHILARLDHPGIARLLDGGTILGDGRSGGSAYFVLELVDGQAIDVYCREKKLPLRDRLILFRKVCSAVHFAHRSLIVHQDLKPSNILVTPEGEPKLLDFGIARILQREGVEVDPTSTYAALTPGYASPEQVRGEAVTTASDLYSLGVLLYELLAGRHPYRGGGRDQESTLTPEAWLRAVCQEDPVPPSVAAAGTEALFARQLAGDLDTVVLKAMAKEPGERYLSAEHLAEDLRRSLEGFPVLARPASSLHRLRKLAWRHPLASTALAAAALAMLSVVMLVVLLQQQNRQLERQRAVAEEVSTFATGLFQLAEPGALDDRDLSALQLLKEGEEKVYRELADQPATQAKMLDVLGMAYFRLTLFHRARPLLAAAVRLLEETPGAEPLALAESRLHLAEALRRLRDHEAAEPLYRQALETRRQILGERHEGVAEVLLGLGELIASKESSAAARSTFEEAGEILRETVGEVSPQMASVLFQLATEAQDRREYDVAGEMFETARRLTEETLGTRHVQYAQCLYGLGVFYFDSGDLDTGADYLSQALRLQERLLAPGDFRLFQTLANLGRSHIFRGRTAQAVETLRSAIDQARIHHSDMPQLDHIMLSLAFTTLERGGFEEARRLLRELAERERALAGRPYLWKGKVERLEGEILLLEGEAVAAERVARRIWSSLQERPTGKASDVFGANYFLAKTLLEQGRLDEARAFYEQAAETQGGLPRDHPLRVPILGAWVELALAEGNPREALRLVAKARESAPRSITSDPANEAWFQSVEGEALARVGDKAAARPLLIQGHLRLLELLGEKGPAVVEAARWLELLD